MAVIQPLLIPINAQVQQFIAAKQADGKPSARSLVEISEKLMLIGDFIKYCSGLSERTGTN